jgi:hypothetical protein
MTTIAKFVTTFCCCAPGCNARVDVEADGAPDELLPPEPWRRAIYFSARLRREARTVGCCETHAVAAAVEFGTLVRLERRP